MNLPKPGDMFEGKYEVLDVLGRGGHASVFRARDVEVARDVAIKVLMPSEDGTQPEGLAARFMVEARVLAGLSDPHTIRLFEFGQSAAGHLYMVFQYVAGEDLAALLARSQRLDPVHAIHIANQVLHGLNEAHEAGVLHRDIKPANILIHSYMGDDFAAKVLDFGIAKVDPGADGVALTKTGAIIGTPRYMSPEQIFGEPLGPMTDIYSLGLVLFEMLTGHPAAQGSSRELMRRQISSDPFIVPEHAGWPELRAVVARMIAKAPEQRFQSVTDVIQALSVASQQRPVVPPHSSASAEIAAPQQLPEPPKEVEEGRGPLRALAAGAVLGVAAVLVIMNVNPDSDEQTSTQGETQLPPELLHVAAARTLAPVDAGQPAPPDSSSGPADLSAADDAGPAPDGCGLEYEDKWERFGDIGPERDVRHYLPSGYEPNRRYPLIVAFQPPYIANGKFILQSGMGDLVKDQNNAIVVGLLPSDRLLPWEHPDPEIDYIRRAVADARKRFCVDPRRVYAIGHGPGARMVRHAACSLPFSAVALSGFAESSTRPMCEASPVPAVRIVGRDDPFVPIDGGTGCATQQYISSEDEDSRWLERNACKPTGRKRRVDAAECTEFKCDAEPFTSCLSDGGYYLRSANWTIMHPRCSAELLKADVAQIAWPFFEQHGRDIDPAAFVPK